MSSRSISSGVVFVAVVFVALLAVGTLLTSGPSEATIDADRQPTTTTTTEPPPEGETVVFIENGAMRPSNLELDLEVIQVVKWVNLDDRIFVIEGGDGTFMSQPLGQGDEFSFDYSTLPPGLHRYKAVLETNSLIGGVRIPGIVDSRPAQ